MGDGCGLGRGFAVLARIAGGELDAAGGIIFDRLAAADAVAVIVAEDDPIAALGEIPAHGG